MNELDKLKSDRDKIINQLIKISVLQKPDEDIGMLREELKKINEEIRLLETK